MFRTLQGSTHRGETKRVLLAVITLLLLTCVSSEPTLANVVVNGKTVSGEARETLETQFQIKIPGGKYWYDATSGAWGVENGPTLGFTLPGYPLGGELKPEASGGSEAGSLTGVFVNGRELHPTDYMNLTQLTPVAPGRYWLDHAGNAGFEGGPAIVNLWQLADRAATQRNAYHRRTSAGYIGGDGQSSYFFDPETGASVMN